jgi:hypothetical protein
MTIVDSLFGLGRTPRHTKESIIEKTYISENLSLPLFSKEGDSSLLQREGRRDLVFSIYTIMG